MIEALMQVLDWQRHLQWYESYWYCRSRDRSAAEARQMNAGEPMETFKRLASAYIHKSLRADHRRKYAHIYEAYRSLYTGDKFVLSGTLGAP